MAHVEGPATPATASSVDQLLEEYINREQRALDALRRDGASWFVCWRQKRRLDRALEALQWSDVRTMGDDAFIKQHGLLRTGVWAGVSAAVGWAMLMGVSGVREAVWAAFVGTACGAMVGLLSGIADWDRAESKFQQTLADLGWDSTGQPRSR